MTDKGTVYTYGHLFFYVNKPKWTGVYYSVYIDRFTLNILFRIFVFRFMSDTGL